MALWQAAPCAASATTPSSRLRLAAGVSDRHRRRKPGSLLWMCAALAGARHVWCFLLRFFSPEDLHIRILRNIIYPLWLLFKWVETTKQFFFDGGVLEDSNPKSCFCSRQPGVIRDKEDTVVLEAFPTKLSWFPISTHFSQRFWLVLRLSP